MDPIIGFAAKRAANWWLRNRPFSPEKRAFRKQRKAIRRKNRERKKLGLPPLEEPKMEIGFRTSTVAGVTGVITLVLMKVLAIVAPEFVAAVPGLEETVAGIAAYIAARLNKTPKDPGVV